MINHDMYKKAIASYVDKHKDDLIGSNYDVEDYNQMDLSTIGDPTKWVVDPSGDGIDPEDVDCWDIANSADSGIDINTNTVCEIDRDDIKKHYLYVFVGSEDLEYYDVRFGVYILKDETILLGEF